MQVEDDVGKMELVQSFLKKTSPSAISSLVSPRSSPRGNLIMDKITSLWSLVTAGGGGDEALVHFCFAGSLIASSFSWTLTLLERCETASSMLKPGNGTDDLPGIRLWDEDNKVLPSLALLNGLLLVVAMVISGRTVYHIGIICIHW